MWFRSHDPIFVKVGQRSRSYGYIMYSGKMCYNSITGDHMNFILGSQHEDDPPTSEAQRWLPSNGVTKSAVYYLIFQKLKRL